MIIFSRILPPIGVFDIGLKSLRALGGFSLGIGIISEILYASGNIPDFRAQFVMSLNGNASYTVNSSNIRLGKSLGPKDFFENFFRSL